MQNKESLQNKDAMHDKAILQRLEAMGQPYLPHFAAEYALISAGLSPARMMHSLGVAAAAARLAERFGADPQKAYLAGLCHDAAKELPAEEMRELLLRSPMGEDADVMAHKSLWHAPAGSVWLADRQSDFPRFDAEIQDACLWHTLGKPAMKTLEQIVFIADLIEPGRDFPDLAEIRAAAEISLLHGMAACMNGVIRFLEVRNQFVHPLAYAGYDYYKKQL